MLASYNGGWLDLIMDGSCVVGTQRTCAVAVEQYRAVTMHLEAPCQKSPPTAQRKVRLAKSAPICVEIAESQA